LLILSKSKNVAWLCQEYILKFGRNREVGKYSIHLKHFYHRKETGFNLLEKEKADLDKWEYQKTHSLQYTKGNYKIPKSI